MTPGEHFRLQRERLDLTQAALATVLGVTDRAVRNWESGDSRAPRWARLCLRLMAERGLNAKAAAAREVKRAENEIRVGVTDEVGEW